MSLAHDLELRGETDAALALLRRLTEMSAEIRGPHHARTLFSRANLSCLLRHLGETSEAQEILDTVLPPLREQLGADHPEVALAETGEFIEFEMELPDR